MLACGPGQSCCGECQRGGGLGGFPNIEYVLQSYVDDKLSRGERFYISPKVNSDTLRYEPGMGAFMAAIAALAAKIGPAVVKGAEVYGTVKAMQGGGGGGTSSGQLSSQDIANAITPQVVANMQAQGVQLPAAVANQVTTAGLMDVFGANTKPILIAVGVGLAALLLLRRR